MPCDGAKVKLGPKEFAILRELVTHAGEVPTRRRLFRAILGRDDGDRTSLRIFVRRLRATLEGAPARPAPLLTGSGAGDRLSV